MLSLQWKEVILSDDTVAAFSEEIILFVKFSLVFSDGHVETFLLKVWLLLLTDGGLLQNLLDTEPYRAFCLKYIQTYKLQRKVNTAQKFERFRMI